MSDIRNINLQRQRRWGDHWLTLAKLTGDDTYTTLCEIADDFLVTEPRDESGSDRGLNEGEPLFRFRLYGAEEVESLDLNAFNLALFAGTRYEVKTKERKLMRPPFVEITARPIGAI